MGLCKGMKWGYAKVENSYKKNRIAMEMFISLTYVSGTMFIWHEKIKGLKALEFGEIPDP